MSQSGRRNVVTSAFGIGASDTPEIVPEAQEREPAQGVGRPPTQADAQVIAGGVGRDLEWRARSGQHDRRTWDNGHASNHLTGSAGRRVQFPHLISGGGRDLLGKGLAGAEGKAGMRSCEQTQSLRGAGIGAGRPESAGNFLGEALIGNPRHAAQQHVQGVAE